MKFDYIIGNPPYQGPSGNPGDKIYTKISKRMYPIFKNQMAFVTPTGFTRSGGENIQKSNIPIKLVDFTADSYFDVGVAINWWLLDKTFLGSRISVTASDNSMFYVPQGKSVMDKTKYSYTADILDELRKNKPEDRLMKFISIDEPTQKKVGLWVSKSLAAHEKNMIYGAPQDVVAFCDSFPKPKSHNNWGFIEVSEEESKKLRAVLASIYPVHLDYMAHFSGGFNQYFSYLPKDMKLPKLLLDKIEEKRNL